MGKVKYSSDGNYSFVLATIIEMGGVTVPHVISISKMVSASSLRGRLLLQRHVQHYATVRQLKEM